MLWLVTFIGTFLTNFSDFLFDTVWPLFIEFIDMTVGFDLFISRFIFGGSAGIVVLRNLVFTFGVKLISSIEVPRNTFCQVIITVAFQTSDIHRLSESVI